jgi:transcriptional regulator with XRE-family HTH domain
MSDTPHPTDLRVGRLLRERRLQLGISQERLGAMLGVTYQQVQKYERGANRIGSSRLHDLCKILGVRASYFFDEPETAEASGLSEAAPSGFDLSGAGAPDARVLEAQELLAAFRGIVDPEIRRRLVDLVRALALHGSHPGTGNT